MKKRILIVDDEPNSVEPMMMLFEEEGYELKLMNTHAGIFHIIDEFKPNLILLDVFLKGSDGRYICNLLKSMNKTKTIPIVLISGIMDAQQLLQEDIEADAFLHKPFDIDESIQRVKALMN